MTADEIVYILQRPTAAKIDLLVQLKELEKAGEDFDFKLEIKEQLDVMCGIPGLLHNLGAAERLAISRVYERPKKVVPKAMKDLALLAVGELVKLVDAQTWDLSRYASWRRQHETCAACLRSWGDVQDCWMDPNGVLRSLFQNHQ